MIFIWTNSLQSTKPWKSLTGVAFLMKFNLYFRSNERWRRVKGKHTPSATEVSGFRFGCLYFKESLCSPVSIYLWNGENCRNIGLQKLFSSLGSAGHRVGVSSHWYELGLAICCPLLSLLLSEPGSWWLQCLEGPHRDDYRGRWPEVGSRSS